MKINDIIKQVANLLQLTNVMELNFANIANADAQTKKDVNLMLSSTNEVLSNISTEYLPPKTTESITVTGGAFDLTTLDKTFYKLVKVETIKPYTLDFETLLIEDGQYAVEYLYLPEEYELGDEVLVFDKKLTIYVVAYAVASEFCVISGNYSEADMWESKFKNSIEKLVAPHKIAELKGRRWL